MQFVVPGTAEHVLCKHRSNYLDYVVPKEHCAILPVHYAVQHGLQECADLRRPTSRILFMFMLGL